MKIQISKEEVIQLVRDVIPVPSGFKLGEVTWESYNNYMEVEIEQIQPRQTLNRPIFPTSLAYAPVPNSAPDGDLGSGPETLGEDL